MNQGNKPIILKTKAILIIGSFFWWGVGLRKELIPGRLTP